MKSYHEQELMNIVNRIEKQAAFEALDKVMFQLNRKADVIEHLLYSDESINIYHLSKGHNFDRIWDKRQVLQQKQRTIYQIADTIYDIRSQYI